MLEPRVLAVELVAEPCGEARFGFFGFLVLMYVEVQQGGVDAFGKEAVNALFHNGGIAAEHGASAGARLGPDTLLAVDVAAGGGSAVLDIPERAFAPELAGYFVALASVHKKFGGESPVAVVFEPCREAVLVRYFAEAAHVLVGHHVGHEPAHVP